MIKMSVDKPKKVGRKLSDFKKPIVIGGSIAFIAIAGIITGFFFYSNQEQREPEIVLTFGAGGLPNTLDPLRVDSNQDTYVVETIAEGLFRVDLTSNISRNIYCLATYHKWSDDSLNLTCSLRQGVIFQDGTSFNATAVKWNFDRIYRLIDNPLFAYPGFWLLPDGTPIVNDTQIIDEYTIRFILNAPYAAFESLLTTYSACIASPTSTPTNDFLDIFTEPLVGTGPFIYDTYDYNVSLSLKTNPLYWDEKPKIDRLIIVKKEGLETKMEALLSGEVDSTRIGFVYEYMLDQIRNEPSIAFQQIPNTNLRWIFFNNKKINVTMRKAISYAINYSVVETIGGIRTISPLPKTILYYNKTGIIAPYYNLSIARKALIDANWNGTFGLTPDDDISPGNVWETISNSSYPLATYNYTYIIEWHPNSDMSFFLDLLTQNLKQIGVKINPLGISFDQYLLQSLELFGYTRDMFDISYNFWGADYNDPSNFINLMFTNRTIGLNAGQVNDSLTQMLIDQTVIETNETTRKLLYYQIQKHTVEELYPIACPYSTFITDVYPSNLKGWYSNFFLMPFKTVYFEN